jgi:hypothetical protein
MSELDELEMLEPVYIAMSKPPLHIPEHETPETLESQTSRTQQYVDACVGNLNRTRLLAAI